MSDFINESEIVLQRVYDILGIAPESIPLNDMKTLEALSSKIKLCSFDDLVKFIGIGYGAGKYYEEIYNIMDKNNISLKDTIIFREDILTSLLAYGYDKEKAFAIMGKVRKGLGITNEQYDEMLSCGVPKWFADACTMVDYAPSRSAYEGIILVKYILAYCKVHYGISYEEVVEHGGGD